MKKAVVFILLGQSNAVGHGVPMQACDVIDTPMKNVFGLSRAQNQSFDIASLTWSGYTSAGMNLGEEQDDTYSVANCLARAWQAHIDTGNDKSLSDLYIVQIAIGAQGVSEGYMWHPSYEKRLIPGKLGTVDIALYPFTLHILSLLEKSFAAKGEEFEVIGLHWRGGENDVTAKSVGLYDTLLGIYREMFTAFNALLQAPPIVLHELVCPDRANLLDPTGRYLENMHCINDVFHTLQKEFGNVGIFDARRAPQFLPDVYGNGLFIKDVVHFTPEVNAWVAEEILGAYLKTH